MTEFWDAPGLLVWALADTEEFLSVVGAAEDSGYAEFWYTDIRLAHDAYMALALAARATSRMYLGPGVSDPYTRHPVTIGGSIATLQEMSNGRAIAGLGAGALLSQIGRDQKRPIRAMEEAIAIIRGVLTGQEYTLRGEVFEANAVHLDLGGGRWPETPIFVATHSPQMLQASGRHADGVLLANLALGESIQDAVELVRAGEVQAGRDEGSAAVHLRLEFAMSSSEGEALAAIRNRLVRRLLSTYPKWNWLRDVGLSPTDSLREAAVRRDVDALDGLIASDTVRACAVVGDPAQVRLQLSEISRTPINRLTIRPVPIKHQTTAELVSAFIQEVWVPVRRARNVGDR